MKVSWFSLVLFSGISAGILFAVNDLSRGKRESDENIQRLGGMIDEIAKSYSSEEKNENLEWNAVTTVAKYSDIADVEINAFGSDLRLSIRLMDSKAYSCDASIMLSHILSKEAGVIVVHSGSKKVDFGYLNPPEKAISEAREYCGENKVMPKGTVIDYVFNSRLTASPT